MPYSANTNPKSLLPPPKKEGVSKGPKVPIVLKVLKDYKVPKTHNPLKKE